MGSCSSAAPTRLPATLFFVNNRSLRNTGDLFYASDDVAGGHFILTATVADEVRDGGANPGTFTAYQTTCHTEVCCPGWRCCTRIRTW